ncbi:MAG: sugar ABC transporter permease [Eubacteriales bacterium]|nr:sugar ABC transporter permease [Eubacteriales bacterium]
MRQLHRNQYEIIAVGGKRRRWAPYLFLLPVFVFFISFYYYPFFRTIFTSFAVTDAAGQLKKMVGLKNFTMIFNRKDFYTILLNTLKFVPLIALPTLLGGMLLAVFANRRIPRVSRAVETMFSLPMAIASASAALVWALIYNPVIGIANYLLGTDINWLADERYAMFSVALVTVWLQMGSNFIFLLTALRGVPGELVESGMIDGANGWQEFFHITLPMISPTLFFVIFLDIMGSFQAFGQIRILTQGGPGIATRVLVYDIYLEAFMNYRFGSACAESLILFVMMLGITMVQFRFENKGVHYA